MSRITKRTSSARTALAGLVAACVFMVLFVPCVHALTQEGRVGDVTFTVYAPDWTWQKRDINILVALENKGTSRADVTLRLVLPPGKESDFVLAKEPAEALHRAITLAPGETARQAFTQITAKDGVPLQTYAFAVEAAANDAQTTLAYPLRTIRGEVIGGGKWAALLAPVGLALVWCIAFAVMLRRFSRPGAWLASSEPFAEPDSKEPWIDRTPTS